mgnify:CR=1 FL=1
MAHAEWHRCTFCHAPWLDSFTKHKSDCPLFIDLTPKDPRIFRGKVSDFFDESIRMTMEAQHDH